MLPLKNKTAKARLPTNPSVGGETAKDSAEEGHGTMPARDRQCGVRGATTGRGDVAAARLVGSRRDRGCRASIDLSFQRVFFLLSSLCFRSGAFVVN